VAARTFFNPLYHSPPPLSMLSNPSHRSICLGVCMCVCVYVCKSSKHTHEFRLHKSPSSLLPSTMKRVVCELKSRPGTTAAEVFIAVPQGVPKGRALDMALGPQKKRFRAKFNVVRYLGCSDLPEGVVLGAVRCLELASSVSSSSSSSTSSSSSPSSSYE
jgi:hypothetical protein